MEIQTALAGTAPRVHTFNTRANRSRQLPTAMSIVSPNMRYFFCAYAITCGAH
jgi:hypothetical protein